MLDMEKQKEAFKNHKAQFTDHGNIKILDFKNPDSSEYRIRFLFEEDYYRLHISGDLGELTATNCSNMSYDKFSDFVNNIYYFTEKINCHNRAIYCYNETAAKQYFIEEEVMQERLADFSDVKNEFATIDEIIDEILEDFDDEKGLSQNGYDKLSEIDADAWEYADSIGKESTGMLELYMLAFKLAKEQLSEQNKEGA